MLAHLMKYKELMYFLVHKELKVRYRNSLFGFFWTLLEPLGLMAIYTLVFGYIIDLNKGIEPYPLYVLAGLIPWTFFNNSIRKGTKALSGNASLIRKVYFPQRDLPVDDVDLQSGQLPSRFCLGLYHGCGIRQNHSVGLSGDVARSDPVAGFFYAGSRFAGVCAECLLSGCGVYRQSGDAGLDVSLSDHLSHFHFV